MINKEAIEKVNNGILTADAINGQTTEDDALIEEVIRIFSQVKTLLKEQPPASEYPDSEFTKVQRKAAQLAADAYEEDEEWCPTKTTRLLEACDRLDASEARYEDITGGMMKKQVELIQELATSEASRKELVVACERGHARLLELGQRESMDTPKMLKAAIEKAEKESEDKIGDVCDGCGNDIDTSSEGIITESGKLLCMECQSK